jgi:hypothetical protein
MVLGLEQRNVALERRAAAEVAVHLVVVDAARLLGAEGLLGHHHRAVVREPLRQEGAPSHVGAAQLPAPPAVRDLVRRPEEGVIHRPPSSRLMKFCSANAIVVAMARPLMPYGGISTTRSSRCW